ncbi:MAG: hypothetical protein AAGD38_06130 [Acidobacteriota bacterium]
MADPRGPGLFIGISFGLLVLLAVAAMVVSGGMFVLKRTDVPATADEPMDRAAQIRELTGADTLPPGWTAQYVTGVPMMMQVAVLSDAPPINVKVERSSQDLGDQVVLYARVRGGAIHPTALDAFFDGHDVFGGGDELRLPSNLNPRLIPSETLDRGRFDVQNGQARWVTQSGQIVGSRRGGGIGATVLYDCRGGDDRIHLFFWLRYDKRERLTSRLGAPDNPRSLERLVNHFAPCKV